MPKGPLVRHCFFAGLMISSVLLMSGCSALSGSEANGQRDDETQSPTVHVVKQDVTSVLAVSGITEAPSRISLSVQKSGTVDWKVREGQNVVAGEALAVIGTDIISAPSDGRVVSFEVPDGAKAERNIPLGAFEAFALGIKTEIPVEEAYRLYSTPSKAMANIESGPSGQPCDLYLSVAGEESESPESGLPNFVCLLGPDVKSMPGLPAKLGLKTAFSKQALVLPVESVSGSVQHGQVTAVGLGGDARNVDVKLGISDGNMIEILEGVQEGDTVLAISPSLFNE